MRHLKYLLLLAVLAVPAIHSHAQVAIGVQIGPNYGIYNPPPVCPYGYYPDYPFDCAPYGYYGPQYFVDGVFIGVGPWYNFYYSHPAYWGRFYSRPYFRDWDHDRFYGARRWDGDRGWDRGREWHGQGFRDDGRRFGNNGGGAFRGGDRGFRGNDRGFRGNDRGFHGGNGFRGGDGGRSFHGGGESHGGGSRGGDHGHGGGGGHGDHGRR